MCINSLKSALEENLLSSSHRAQDAENQSSFIRLAELQQKFKSQPLRVQALTGKEQNPVNWNRDVLHPQTPETLPFPPLTKEIPHCLLNQQ